MIIARKTGDGRAFLDGLAGRDGQMTGGVCVGEMLTDKAKKSSCVYTQVERNRCVVHTLHSQLETDNGT